MPQSPHQQFEVFESLMRGGRKYDRGHPVFNAVIQWLSWPIALEEVKRERIRQLVKDAFDLNDDTLREEVIKCQNERRGEVTQNGHVVNEELPKPSTVEDLYERARADEEHFDRLLPKRGYFRDYVNYTLNSEAPLVYHFFCAFAGLAATINRRVHLNMGNFDIFPPLGILILGPSGIKKTSAADIMTSILTEMQLTPVYAEKLTPEALIDSMKGGNATGLVYSPEMTVLISKQRYMESIIPLLTRFMDSPPIWNSGTIMRGKQQLVDVAITCLMCSTLDWFIKNTPESLFGGGFIARNIMVLQEISPRIIALPAPSNLKLRDKIIVELAQMHEFNGNMTLNSTTYARHEEWYHDDKLTRVVDHEILETYYQRKPTHLLRLAMCLHLAACKDLIVCTECWEQARAILEWTEKFLPYLADKMFRNAWGEDQALVLRKIRSKGGIVSHSSLIRSLQYRMPAEQTRKIIMSLRDSGSIREIRNGIEHTYVLIEGVLNGN